MISCENQKSIIVLLYLFKQSAKEDAFLWVCKSWRALHRQGAWKLGRLSTQHDNPISATDIGLSYQLHMLLYIDCMLLTNQSFYSKSNAW